MMSGLNWRRDQLDAVANANPNAKYRANPSRVASLFVPDPQSISWVPFAVREIRRIASKRTIDCIVTTSPPQSTHLTALLTKHLDIPWVADFRDGWNFERLAPPSSFRAVAAMDRAVENRVMRNADAIVAVTKPIAEDIQKRFSRYATVITNGFDPEERRSGDTAGENGTGERSIVYTGTIGAGARQQHLPPLLAGMAIANRELGAGVKNRLTFAGPLTPTEQALIVESHTLARHAGILGRDKILNLQRNADVLVVLVGDDKPGVATGKIFEYLAAGRPILVVGTGNVAATIVEQTGTGIATATTPQAIAAGLVELLRGNAFTPNLEAINAYSWPLLSRRFEGVIETAIEHHAQRRGR
jgi:glycosyltransferase involved in cell wall biosynthesis